MYTIGVDVGGTYTDLVASDESGRAVFAKSPSTPADQSLGVMAGLDELARRLGVTRAEMLAKTDRLVHGTTVATNALLERKGAKVALLTTEGHRDVLEMREGLKPDRYDLRSPPPEPLVPRERRLGVRVRRLAETVPSTSEFTLLIDGLPAGRIQSQLGFFNFVSWNGLDIGRDRGSPVSHYQSPFTFTGKLFKVTVTMDDDQVLDGDRVGDAQLARQ